MQVLTVRPTLINCLVLLLLMSICYGCGSKKPPTPAPAPTKTHLSTPAKKKPPAIPATQRPYVINGITYYPIPSAEGYVERGIASWYGKPFHGRRTANGEIYNMYGDTAAHKTLPMNTMLLVRNLENGRTAVVRINDRGPFVRERIVDLTYTKAAALGIVRNGTAEVEIIALAQRDTAPAPSPRTTTAAVTTPPPEKPPAQDFDKGNFYVQVGAFEKVENARILAQAFSRRGRDVIIQQYPAAGMNLYRVMIFAGTSLARAKVYQQELEAEGFRYAMLLAR
ncbi:septal ring lytic transglycosylase RlpA family protein [Desulfobulbus alkaliphilus]|uniref:septal ring lytic transglycosylase RlpA family protein n=1 Tax=Desulfobulbus alkaliphilus TaxID=869814 RepID=UPI001965A363|nr:septal ring lytic transglycosylase RlpA family protein [Desulfobulbus alkaliphilus]MBM9538508.1 septal ring lytic transglycosylase RlpA family protein [Desulfobulbus alkaliphilus]